MSRQRRMSAAQVARFHRDRDGRRSQARFVLIVSGGCALFVPFGSDYIFRVRCR
ncbi:MAG: hypothetical protein SGI73_09725 [Chloroflexota bacterium]|nr:hypothetical protein [Chloroflexota bacterium]